MQIDIYFHNCPFKATRVLDCVYFDIKNNAFYTELMDDFGEDDYTRTYPMANIRSIDVFEEDSFDWEGGDSLDDSQFELNIDNIGEFQQEFWEKLFVDETLEEHISGLVEGVFMYWRTIFEKKAETLGPEFLKTSFELQFLQDLVREPKVDADVRESVLTYLDLFANNEDFDSHKEKHANIVHIVVSLLDNIIARRSGGFAAQDTISVMMMNDEKPVNYQNVRNVKYTPHSMIVCWMNTLNEKIYTIIPNTSFIFVEKDL